MTTRAGRSAGSRTCSSPSLALRLQRPLIVPNPRGSHSARDHGPTVSARGRTDMLVIGDDLQKLDYKLSPCCNPIPGDDVFGFVTIGEGIKIHRVSCPNAIKLLSNYAYRVVKAKWVNDQLISFLAGLKITGTDELGIVNNITEIISNENNVNMRSINFDTEDGLFQGTVMVYVHDTKHLNHLMENLKKVKGVTRVERIDEKN